MNGLRSASSLLTTIGRGTGPNAAASAWFCVVGVALGAALGGLWWAASLIWPPLLAAGIVLLADLALTGMLHFDGLADSSDGLLPHMERSRRLEVMARPDVGAFGVTVVAIALLLRLAALGSLAPSAWLLAGLWGAARGAMAAGMMQLPYAKERGLADRFAGASPRLAVAGGLAACLGLAAVWDVVAGPIALAAGLLAGAALLRLGQRRLGGYTGDLLGATGVVVETVGLVVAAARW